MTRHIGRHTQTGKQVAVSYMLLPNQTTNALVTYTDQIAENLRRELMNAVNSAEGQSADNLAEVIGRRLYADTGKSILQVLHETGGLTPVSIDEIDMTPDGNHKIPLRSVLEAINQLPVEDGAERFNPHTYNSAAEGQQEQTSVAHNLIEEAKMLEADARFKREKAYQIAPSLRPTPAAVADVSAPVAAEAAVEDVAAPDAEEPANSGE
jgi:hypothetical protein